MSRTNKNWKKFFLHFLKNKRITIYFNIEFIKNLSELEQKLLENNLLILKNIVFFCWKKSFSSIQEYEIKEI